MPNTTMIPLVTWGKRTTYCLLVATALIRPGVKGFSTTPLKYTHGSRTTPSLTPTALNVWWFGGAESSEVNLDDESCELVAVRIDRTSPNSRRIAGSITVPTPMADVWAILTDYDRLAIHVPNLVESRIVSKPSKGENGDGSYRCKLFQKGAQKIVGFEFGASVTMEMKEKIVASANGSAHDADGEERIIGFKCVDSFFFSEFDGDWRAKQRRSESGELETELTYVVDVRPKGPVPVAALEWRIREDVPTNLRAIKKASIEVGLEGVTASRKNATGRSPGKRMPLAGSTAANTQSQTNAIRRATVRRAGVPIPAPVPTKGSKRGGEPVIAPIANGGKKVGPVVAAAKTRGNILQAGGRKAQSASQTAKRKSLPFKVNWEADETMAAYLRD